MQARCYDATVQLCTAHFGKNRIALVPEKEPEVNLIRMADREESLLSLICLTMSPCN